MIIYHQTSLPYQACFPSVRHPHSLCVNPPPSCCSPASLPSNHLEVELGVAVGEHTVSIHTPVRSADVGKRDWGRIETRLIS